MDSLLDLLERRSRPGDQDYVRARRCERLRSSRADAAARTSDEGEAA
jgi:hypothetical protein